MDIKVPPLDEEFKKFKLKPWQRKLQIQYEKHEEYRNKYYQDTIPINVRSIRQSTFKILCSLLETHFYDFYLLQYWIDYNSLSYKVYYGSLREALALCVAYTKKSGFEILSIFFEKHFPSIDDLEFTDMVFEHNPLCDWISLHVQNYSESQIERIMQKLRENPTFHCFVSPKILQSEAEKYTIEDIIVRNPFLIPYISDEKCESISVSKIQQYIMAHKLDIDLLMILFLPKQWILDINLFWFSCN